MLLNVPLRAVGFGCPADQINNVFILPALLTGMEVVLSLSCRESKTIQAVYFDA